MPSSDDFVEVVSAASRIGTGMPVIPVKVRIGDGQSVSTYAFVDSGSSVCFCTEPLLAEPKASAAAVPTRLTLETVDRTPHTQKALW